MDETTYSDAAVIAYINEHFIPVRVDADMRPDLDALYNHGGWPSTLVLTPSRNVVLGGTYISQEEMVDWLKEGIGNFRTEKRPAAEEEKRPQGEEETAAGPSDLRRMSVA